jgi:hypothetical protein
VDEKVTLLPEHIETFAGFVIVGVPYTVITCVAVPITPQQADVIVKLTVNVIVLPVVFPNVIFVELDVELAMDEVPPTGVLALTDHEYVKPD